MTMAVWQLPDGTTGITLASATRRPSTPRTRSLVLTTDIASRPILHEPAWVVVRVTRLAHVGTQLFVGAHVAARRELLPDPRGEGAGGEVFRGPA